MLNKEKYKKKKPQLSLQLFFLAVVNLMYSFNWLFSATKGENPIAATYFSLLVKQHGINFAFELNIYLF